MSFFLFFGLALHAANPEVVPPGGMTFQYLKIKNLPSYQPARTSDGKYLSLTRQEIVAELRAVTGLHLNERGKNLLPAPVPRVSCRYEVYSSVELAWFRRFINWFENELKSLGLTYHKEAWDCDDFSMSLNAFADLALLRAQQHPPPQLIGRLIVRQVNKWAGTPAVGMHEIVIFRAEDGWHVAEPQNGTVGPLATYPNRTYITEILFN